MKINILCVTRQLYENKDKTIKHFTQKQDFGEFFSIKSEIAVMRNNL